MSQNEETVLVPLSRGYEATVDAEDAELIRRYTWHAAPRRIKVYAVGILTRKAHKGAGLPPERKIYMHRLLSQAPEGVEVDHRNGDGLDNRKTNLRICDGSLNRMNVGKPARTQVTSIYRGVSYDKRRNKWECRIQFRGQKVRRRFNSEHEAAAFYNAMATELMGENALCQNALGLYSDEKYEKRDR